MNGTYRSEQATIVPTLCIGLGGIGSRIVNRLAQRAATLPNWESQLRPLTAFAALDTNKFDLDALSHVPSGNRIHIGAFDKVKVIENFRADHNAQALQWLPANYQPRGGIKPGAGQIRLESRLGFFFNSPDFRQRLTQIVKDLLDPKVVWRRNDPPEFHVYLYCTIAGGTGSGSFLPMAYLLRDVVRSQGQWQPRVIGNMLLSTMVLDKVGQDLHADVHANAYAALKELEHLTKLDYKAVKDEGRKAEPFVYWYDRSRGKDEIPVVTTSPFFLSLIYDKSNVTVLDAEAVVADTAYLQIFTPNVGNMASALDNYEKKLGELTRFPGDLRSVGQGYAKNYGAVGAAALLVPSGDLLEYSAFRFAAEALRSQITFGVSTTDVTDDRARALARFAINYDDPKFLRMGDEGRDQVINKAFIESVRELGRQDERQEIQDGFWQQLVESIDDGRLTGTSAKGEEQRSESIVDLIGRRLDEARRPLLNRVGFQERAFSFFKDSVNQYTEQVSRLREDIRRGRQQIEEGSSGLRTAASEGDVVTDLKLDPVSERFLVLRLLDRCETKWLPEAQAQLETARTKDITDSKVSDRLDEYYKSLQDAASARGIPFMRNDGPFMAVREEAQDYYRSIAAAARKLFDAELRLAQVRALYEYLQARGRQYARLARFINALVTKLEQSAESIRQGSGAVPRLALSVEVFETLEEPRVRIWDQVFKALFVDDGQFLTTFDRSTLARCIAEQLRPEIRVDGTTVPKSDDKLEGDLRDALVALGRQRLTPTIYGDGSARGLDVARGLDLEARLVLAKGRPRADVAADAIEQYVDNKIRALDHLSGVMARSSAEEWAARGDGVVVDRTRHVIHGFGASGEGAPTRFIERLRAILGTRVRTMNIDRWHDPRIVIVYDVELPVPLYYFRPVLEELEPAYLKVQADEKRGYNLHIDMNWEETLPNLNPLREEIAVGWSLRMLASGLLAGLVERHADGSYTWRPMDEKASVVESRSSRPLGDRLSGALYQLGELHRRADLKGLRDGFEQEARDRIAAMPDAAKRRKELAETFVGADRAIQSRKLEGTATVQDALDRPIFAALAAALLSGAAS